MSRLTACVVGMWLADPDPAGAVGQTEADPAGVGLDPGVATLPAILLRQ
jgi:hypothetical protein